MPALSREQFNHICDMLKAQGIPVNEDNILRYLKQNKNQMTRLAKNVEKNARHFDLQRHAYLQDILFTFKLFGYTWVFYKYGRKRGFMELIPLPKNKDKKNVKQ